MFLEGARDGHRARTIAGVFHSFTFTSPFFCLFLVTESTVFAGNNKNPNK